MPKGPSLKKYVEDIKPAVFTCLWDPTGDWHKAHGDGKSSTKGAFHTETMFGTDGYYHVRVQQGGTTLIGPLNLGKSPAPTAEKVVEELKRKMQ